MHSFIDIFALTRTDGSDAEQAEVAGRTYGIVGKKQRGKTCVLNYAVQYAKENEWLTVAVKPRDFYYDIPGFIVESKHSETLYDQPLGSAKFFANLRDTESAQLKKVVLKQTYSHLNWVPDLTNKVGRGTDDSLLPIQLIQSEYDASRHGADVDASSLPTDRTLFDLVALAAVDETQSADILYSFIEELKMTTEVPVVVAIDNFNEFDLLSEFVRPNNPHMRIPSRRLSLCKSFVDLAHHNPAIASSASSSSSPDSFSPLANGVVLFAHTASGQSVRHMVADLECATPVEVTRCTDSETENAFLHYKASNKMYAGQDKIADPNWMGEKRMLTQGIFGEVSFMAGLH